MVRFTSYSKKVEALKGTRNLWGTGIKNENDNDEARRMCRKLTPYLKGARRQDNIVFIVLDKEVVN